MANDKDQFKFDLDARDAAAQLNDLKDKVMSIGDVKNLSGLVKGLTSLAGPIAAVGAAVLAVKVAFDMSKEGEQIEKIHRQFDAFAESVGVNSKRMEENIQKSIGTTEDLDDALKSAQKAMSLLGNNSDKIPQFFTIAKQAAEAFGGTMNERFDQITQAVARGNAGMLRQIGITIDSEKALKSYATAIGTTVSALSEQGRQAAIAEAVLKKAEDRYKNVKVETEGIETSTKRFGTTWKETGDTIALAMNKTFGPTFAKMIDAANDALKSITTTLKANFGSGMDQANAQLEVMQTRVGYAQKALDQLNQQMGGEHIAKGTAEWKVLNQQLEIATRNLEAQKQVTQEKSDLDEMDRARQMAQEAVAKKQEGGGGSDDIDSAKKLDQTAKFNNELLKLSEQRINDQLVIETNAEEYKMLLVMQRNNATAQYDAQIAETKRQGLEGEVITKQQADEMIIQLEADKAARIEAINRDMDQAQLKVYDNQVKAAQTAGQGISAAFAQGAANAQASMKNYGSQGQMVFKTLTTHAAAAFSALGEGSKSAGDIMKGFLFGSIAAVAEAQGQFLLASGIGTMNPVQIAEGGALVALAGLLRSQAGSAGGDSVGGSSGGGGGVGGGASPGASSLTEKPELQDEKKKSVTVQVMGNYFETEQTKTRLLEMIRENTDATDFKYQQIGVGG